MQPVQSDDWRPGFAKRADNFSQVCAQAEAWRWSPGESAARVCAAVLKGTPTLTIPQRMTLMLYAEHLNDARLEQGVACVWPSTALIADYLGCSQSQARANRRALEAAGYLVRDYTRANRPAGVEAYDLRPLMGRLAELEGIDVGIREAMLARRATYSENVVFASKYSARAPESRRLEQSQKNELVSVRAENAAARSSNSSTRASIEAKTNRKPDSGSRRETAKDGAIGSSAKAVASGSAGPDPKAYAEMVRQELRSAATACPRVATLITPALLADPATVSPEDAARAVSTAAALLPNPERNNDQTAMWGWRKHGARVLVMLAIALEDPQVRNPSAYFGKLTGQSLGAADLRLNLARILAGKGSVAPAEPVEETHFQTPLMFAPGSEDPPWPEIATELRRIVREGAWGSWFSRIGFHGLVDGVLTLSAPLDLAADRIRRDYLPAILQAATAADVFVERVVVTVRKR